MKAFCFLVLAVALVSAHPGQGANQTECRLSNLIPKGSLSIPDVSADGLPPSAINDPLNIQNVSATLNEEKLKGTYTLTNGVVEGLSTLSHDFNYDPIRQRILLNATIKRVRLTGLYEIVDGQANLTTLGQHTFSGKGPLNASASGVVASLGLKIVLDVQTQFVSIADLKLDFDFSNANIVAENLVVDGVPVEWETVNQNIRPIYEELWLGAHDFNVQLIQSEINKLLEGCTLMDLIELVTSPHGKPDE